MFTRTAYFDTAQLQISDSRCLITLDTVNRLTLRENKNCFYHFISDYKDCIIVKTMP